MRKLVWNFGDLLEGIDAVLPGDAAALVHQQRRVSWSEFARHSNNLAAALRARGAKPDDKIAIYLRNCPEYMETLAASFKARLVHVNVNFRYLDDELAYVFDNSDARIVVFGEEFCDRVAALQQRCRTVKTWVQVGGSPSPFAESYDALVAEGSGEPLGIERSQDDLFFIYTGGTTGMPKGVMWRNQDLWGALGYGANNPANAGSKPQTPREHIDNVGRFGASPLQIVACPLMHGTGILTSMSAIAGGSGIVTLGGSGFDPVELFDTVESSGAASVIIVGDAFARPMLNTLNQHRGRWKLESLKVILSSGVMWSREVKLGLLEHIPGAMLADMFGSSEAVGFGASVSSAKDGAKTARFTIGENCKVFTEDHREVRPGSGERGFVARSGPIPLGYYKDPEKSAKTFPTISGTRYSIPGDWCTVEADGTLNLLGRGSVCINTAGEKVYPEEIEETLKTHDDIEDALVFGLADNKWGQAVTALVELRRGAVFDEAALRSHVRKRLAGYKTPKRILAVPTMFRAPNGKPDYKSATTHAARELALS